MNAYEKENMQEERRLRVRLEKIKRHWLPKHDAIMQSINGKSETIFAYWLAFIFIFLGFFYNVLASFTYDILRNGLSKQDFAWFIFYISTCTILITYQVWRFISNKEKTYNLEFDLYSESRLVIKELEKIDKILNNRSKTR